MSSATSVNSALADYTAGRMTAQQLVGVVAAAYYENRGVASGEWLRPVIEVIERAHPGVIELRGTADRPGFEVRLQERPFPKQFESALREAALSVAVAETNHFPLPTPSLLTRLVRAIRKVFSA